MTASERFFHCGNTKPFSTRAWPQRLYPVSSGWGAVGPESIYGIQTSWNIFMSYFYIYFILFFIHLFYFAFFCSCFFLRKLTKKKRWKYLVSKCLKWFKRFFFSFFSIIQMYLHDERYTKFSLDQSCKCSITL